MQLPDDYPLVTVAQLHQALSGTSSLCLLDARSDPADGSAPGRGRRQWAEGHLPGAWHADLDTDLSDHTRPGEGRHPLPDDTRFAATLGRWGIGPDVPVVVYDASDGSLAAARAWWMLHLIGHRQVWVLDGGLDAWVAAGLPLCVAEPVAKPCPPYPGRFDDSRLLDVDALAAQVATGDVRLVDARSSARFAGHVEPIDPVAGHVPGAVNLPYTDMVCNGQLLPAAQLRERISAVLGTDGVAGYAVMCGSGVTACHLLLSMACAGLDGARLYAGSWSGWITDPSRPVAGEPG